MNPGSDCLDDEEVELIKQMERNGADYAMIARTISERTGYLYTANQMRYLSKKEAALLADGLNPDASSADNLIAEFRKRYVLRVPCMIRCFRSYAFFVAMRTVLPAVVLSFFLEVLREVLSAVFFFW
jgi:hypothetical protein